MPELTADEISILKIAAAPKLRALKAVEKQRETMEFLAAQLSKITVVIEPAKVNHAKALADVRIAVQALELVNQAADETGEALADVLAAERVLVDQGRAAAQTLAILQSEAGV